MTDVKQTGAERLEQVREALAPNGRWLRYEQREAWDALDGCVLLTAEERERADDVARRARGATHFLPPQTAPASTELFTDLCWLVDLLTPADNTPDAEIEVNRGPIVGDQE